MTRRELEKTQHLLVEAKAACSVESVNTKIQAALDEVERVLSIPALASSPAPAPAASASLSTGVAPHKSIVGGLVSRNSFPSAAALVRNGSMSQLKQRGYVDIIDEDQVHMAGDLWKRGSRLRQMIKRYYVLHGNFLYYYACVRS
jgi:hypothetical protein